MYGQRFQKNGNRSRQKNRNNEKIKGYEEQEKNVFEFPYHRKGLEPSEGICGKRETCVGGQGL